MSLDTKYRPMRFDNVLGQEATIKILRRFIATGAVLRQSYLFAGPWGCGKTTLGRILARAILCPTPTPEGDPCDACLSCRSMLDQGNSLDFIEVDAATNSGKAEIQRITEELQYDTFSGRRRLYLFDESHQLSREALDAMLKPLEENVYGTSDKKLVCIFCTTEPEKMRTTILSRCAPAFMIQAVSPVGIAERLAWICDQEHIAYDLEILSLIAEITECHIRDALKAIEGVSLLGPINRENTSTYLRLDLQDAYLDILANIAANLPAAMAAARRVLERTSPVSVYGKLAEMSMMAYQVAEGAAKCPTYLDPVRLMATGKALGPLLITYAQRFAGRPGHPTPSMLMCDLAALHYGGAVAVDNPTVVFVGAPAATVRPSAGSVLFPTPLLATGVAPPVVVSTPDPVNGAPKNRRSPEAIVLDQRAVGKPGATRGEKIVAATDLPAVELSPSEFCRLLALHVRELDRSFSGPARRSDLDSPGIDPGGGG